MLLTAEGAVLLLIDLQERLMPVIADHEAVVARSVRLAEAAQLLDVPIRATEQHPAGLGATVPPLAAYPQATRRSCSSERTTGHGGHHRRGGGRPPEPAGQTQCPGRGDVRHALDGAMFAAEQQEIGAIIGRPNPKRSPRSSPSARPGSPAQTDPGVAVESDHGDGARRTRPGG